MAGEQKRKERAALITKALLLGYTFEHTQNGYLLVKPDGKEHYEWKHKGGLTHGPVMVRYPALHLAAIEALKLSGVYDATKPSGDTGVGSGKAFRLRCRRRLRACVKGQFKSPWPRS